MQLLVVQLEGGVWVTASMMPSIAAVPPLKVKATLTVRSKNGEWSPAMLSCWMVLGLPFICEAWGEPICTVLLLGRASRA